MKDDLAPAEAKGSGGFSSRNVDRIVAVVFILLGLAVASDSYRLGYGWTDEGMQSGYFPFRVGLLMALVGIGLFVKLTRKKGETLQPFSDLSGLKRIAKVLIPTIIYAALIRPFGIYEPSLIFMLYFTLAIGKQPIHKSLLISIVSVVFVFVLFEIIFSIPLPKGYLEHLLGY